MRAFLIVLLLILALLIGVGSYHDSMLTRHYNELTQLTPESQVRAVMGTPSQTSSECFAYGTQLATNCNHALIYRSAFSFLTQKHWLIFIDKDGRMTAKSRQVNP